MALGRGDDPTWMESWILNASDTQFNAVAGAIGGFTSGVVTCPLDVAKTKLQAQGGFIAMSKGRHDHPRMYNGLVGTFKTIFKNEGIRGLYRGLGPIVLGYLPTWAVWFTVYNKSKEYLTKKGDTYDLLRYPIAVNFCSSIFAGASSTIVTNPIWVIKTRLMSQSGSNRNQPYPRSSSTPTSRPHVNSPWHYNSTIDAARKMYSTEGLRSFYSGLAPALLGLSHVAVQFPAYEYLRKKFTGQGMGETSDNFKNEWLGVLSASIFSKILASSATYPHEVVRTRLQTQRRPTPGIEYLQGLGISETASGGRSGPDGIPEPKYKGIVRTVRTIYAEEGLRAFYAGMGVNMLRAVPAATVTMMTYEFVMKTLHHEKSERKRVLFADTAELREP
ncbi:hypothetical protein PG990_004596 [Apiospora arundinis]|uniref:Mitochondrial carrier domain-containing protein n=1 Tax=Apiospora arundinis TaxID=335852 RepID=A0ABR2J5J6_9PEZI